MANKSWAMKAGLTPCLLNLADVCNPVAGISKRGVLFVLISGHRHNDKI